jgi:hypothetical protein
MPRLVLTKLEFSCQISIKDSRIRVHENPLSGCQRSSCREKTGSQADMTKLTVAFHNFANMPKNRIT